MRCLSVVVLTLVALLFPVADSTACTSSDRTPGQFSYSSVYLNLSGVPSAYRTTIAQGGKKWNKTESCPNGGLPQVSTSPPDGSFRQLNAQFVPGFQPAGGDACGEFIGNDIYFYEFARDEFGRTIPCTRTDVLEDTAAHEIGHAYGLNDSGCSNYIMGMITFSSNSYVNRAVRPAECDAVDETHETPEEVASGTQEDGGADDTPPGGPPESCDIQFSTCTPILIDLDRGGFRLTSAAGGVDFDIDRDGLKERLAWTETGGGDAWLTVDRDGNGWIDHGGELFGNFTDQPVSEDPNGYRALAVYDEDGDRRITPLDSVFEHLRLWVDADHDGESQVGELEDLQTAGVEWIGLDPVVSRSRDRHGNEFRYRGLVGTTTGTTQSVDVFLRGLP